MVQETLIHKKRYAGKKRILLLSDTHSYLSTDIDKYINQVDEIWHAGDLGSLDVELQLAKMKPLYGVYGNIDNNEIRKGLPLNQVFHYNNLVIVMTHIAGALGSYSPRVRGLLGQHKPQVFICGHSHILKIQYDKKYHTLYMNPGAYGKHGFHKKRTFLLFEISTTIEQLKVVELGDRGSV